MTIGWPDTLAGVVRKTVIRNFDRKYRQARRKVAQGLQLPKLTHSVGSIWAVAMVKNEEDIIASTIHHMFHQGIDQMLIVDNKSTDGTVRVIESLAKRYPIYIGTDNETGYFQDHKMTALTKHVGAAGAEWVIPFDADEFWFAQGTSVAQFLRNQAAAKVEAKIYNVFPTKNSPELTGLQNGSRFDLKPHLMPKIAVRPHPLVWVEMGNHSALRHGSITGGLRIAHVPWRSRSQLIGKLRQGANAYAATHQDGVGGHWRRLGMYDTAELERIWSLLLEGKTDPSLGWHPVGPFARLQLENWETWDPDNQIPTDSQPQHPTF